MQVLCCLPKTVDCIITAGVTAGGGKGKIGGVDHEDESSEILGPGESVEGVIA